MSIVKDNFFVHQFYARLSGGYKPIIEHNKKLPRKTKTGRYDLILKIHNEKELIVPLLETLTLLSCLIYINISCKN